MAAHLDLIHLRRHALPAHFMPGLDRGANCAATSHPAHDAGRRPRLLAAWRLDADGRLACTWSADPDDPA